MIYDFGYVGELNNSELFIKNKKTSEEINLKLDQKFGQDIGSFLKVFNPDTVIPDEYKILESLIKINNGKLSIYI
jgi:hypothetical protein